uniref:Uncharacterized protein n=1 Tax=Romanomermis culicivorax TaxID=13658 RepID=A0A915HM65_ROMCU
MSGKERLWKSKKRKNSTGNFKFISGALKTGNDNRAHFEPIEDNKLYALASLLDPRFKKKNIELARKSDTNTEIILSVEPLLGKGRGSKGVPPCPRYEISPLSIVSRNIEIQSEITKFVKLIVPPTNDCCTPGMDAPGKACAKTSSKTELK